VCVAEKVPDMSTEPLKTTFKTFLIVVVFSIAFGYIEAAVVVYLRQIFHPDGFIFPMTVFGTGPLFKRFLLTEIGREAATIVLIFTGAWLSGHNRQQRLAYFLIIFAVWDIFYYIWLKVLLDWPASRCSCGRSIRATLPDWLGFSAAGLIMVVSFCLPGLHITEQDFASYFYRPLFAAGYLFGLVIFLKCLLKPK